MRCSTFLAIIALILTHFLPTTATAGSITYTVVDYSALGIQNNMFGQPVHMSGTITTDGTTGSGLLDPGIILSWNLTFTQGTTTTANIAVNGSSGLAHIFGDGLDITDTSIRLHSAGTGTGLDLAIFPGPRELTEWTSGEFVYLGPDPTFSTTWDHFTSNFGSPNFSPIAEALPVGEPATVTLLAIGVVGMAGYGWRRKKQQATLYACTRAPTAK
jgi:hypothetical protein